MDQDKTSALQTSYDKIAEEYVRQIYDELKDKPLDRQLLDRFARSVQGLGPVCDMGCGPGHVGRYLHDQGVAQVIGVDLSPGMIEQARRLNPGIEFIQGNMLALDIEDHAWGGIAAFYSIIHIPREEVVTALCELKRVLEPGGYLFIAFHRGDENLHQDELWEQKVSIDFYLFQSDEMVSYLKQAGFTITDVIERPPYADVEYPSHRTYIFAKKPE